MRNVELNDCFDTTKDFMPFFLIRSLNYLLIFTKEMNLKSAIFQVGFVIIFYYLIIPNSDTY